MGIKVFFSFYNYVFHFRALSSCSLRSTFFRQYPALARLLPTIVETVQKNAHSLVPTIWLVRLGDAVFKAANTCAVEEATTLATQISVVYDTVAGETDDMKCERVQFVITGLPLIPSRVSSHSDDQSEVI